MNIQTWTEDVLEVALLKSCCICAYNSFYWMLCITQHSCRIEEGVIHLWTIKYKLFVPIDLNVAVLVYNSPYDQFLLQIWFCSQFPFILFCFVVFYFVNHITAVAHQHAWCSLTLIVHAVSIIYWWILRFCFIVKELSCKAYVFFRVRI